MRLAIHLGRTAALAEREVLAVAPLLPFPWTSTSLSSEWVMLKPTGDEARWSADQLGKLSELQQHVCVLQQRLGGAIRIAWLEREVSRHDLVQALYEVAHRVREELIGDGRGLGLSIWGNADAHKMGIKLKRMAREAGWSCRVVIPRQGATLSPAHVAGEYLAKLPFTERAQKGIELVAIQAGEKWWIGVTLTAANIDFYSERDFGIPVPDPVSGMLPPKLAQMMINVAVGAEHVRIYDPFCGNGRIVLEGLLMGLPVSGSDVEQRKVDATDANAAWLKEKVTVSEHPEVWLADATEGPGRSIGEPFVIVTEPYLGKPLRAPLRPDEQRGWLDSLVPLYDKFLTYWATAPEKPHRMLVVFPRAKGTDGRETAVFVALIDRLEQIGYSAEVLFCYDRPDSIVRRDLVRITYSH